MLIACFLGDNSADSVAGVAYIMKLKKALLKITDTKTAKSEPIVENGSLFAVE